MIPRGVRSDPGAVLPCLPADGPLPDPKKGVALP